MTAAVLDGGFVPAEDLIPAERVVIGWAMRSTRSAEELGDLVRPEHFFRPQHQMIFSAITRLAEAGNPVDPAAVLGELTRCGDLQKIPGGGGYLHDCMSVAQPAGYHARRVAGDYRRRMLHAAGVRIQQVTGDPSWSVDEAMEDARLAVDQAAGGAAGSPLPTMATLAARVLERIERGTVRGVATGISRDLDRALAGGYVAGQLILIAARPGAGKSVALAQSALAVAASTGRPVLLSSLEMTDEEITMRLMAARARVSLLNLLQGTIADSDWDRLHRAHGEISDSTLRIDYAPGCGLAHIRSRLRGIGREGVPALLAVDYLQLVKAPSQSRQEEVATVARELKNMAGEFGIPVLAAVQLNRNSEKRSDKRPELADLRESGELEQAADIVMLLHREDLYERESPRAGEADLIIAKNRQGPQTTVTALFQGHYSRLVDMAPLEWTADAISERLNA